MFSNCLNMLQKTLMLLELDAEIYWSSVINYYPLILLLAVSVATCQTMASMDIEAPPAYDIETLPSYTIASGLPSYEDAVRHLTRQHHQHQQQTRSGYEPAAASVARKPSSAYSSNNIHPPSVVKFFESRPQNWLNVTIFEEIHYNFVGRGTPVDDPAATAVPATSSAGLLSDQTTKREAISGGLGDSKSDSDCGFFKIQICMVENEKTQSSNRWEDLTSPLAV